MVVDVSDNCGLQQINMPLFGFGSSVEAESVNVEVTETDSFKRRNLSINTPAELESNKAEDASPNDAVLEATPEADNENDSDRVDDSPSYAGYAAEASMSLSNRGAPLVLPGDGVVRPESARRPSLMRGQSSRSSLVQQSHDQLPLSALSSASNSQRRATSMWLGPFTL